MPGSSLALHRHQPTSNGNRAETSDRHPFGDSSHYEEIAIIGNGQYICRASKRWTMDIELTGTRYTDELMELRDRWGWEPGGEPLEQCFDSNSAIVRSFKFLSIKKFSENWRELSWRFVAVELRVHSPGGPVTNQWFNGVGSSAVRTASRLIIYRFIHFLREMNLNGCGWNKLLSLQSMNSASLFQSLLRHGISVGCTLKVFQNFRYVPVAEVWKLRVPEQEKRPKIPGKLGKLVGGDFFFPFAVCGVWKKKLQPTEGTGFKDVPGSKTLECSISFFLQRVTK